MMLTPRSYRPDPRCWPKGSRPLGNSLAQAVWRRLFGAGCLAPIQFFPDWGTCSALVLWIQAFQGTVKRYFMFILPFISFWKCLKSVLVLGVTQEVENNMLLPRFTQAYSHKRNFVVEEDRARVVSLLHFFSVMFTPFDLFYFYFYVC